MQKKLFAVYGTADKGTVKRDGNHLFDLIAISSQPLTDLEMLDVAQNEALDHMEVEFPPAEGWHHHEVLLHEITTERIQELTEE